MTPLAGSVTVVAAFLGGVLSFLSPCVLPLVPSYLSFVTGMSLDELRAGEARARTLAYALLFVAGFSAIFVTMGATISFLGRFFNYFDVWIARVGGLVIVAMGLHLAGVLRITPLLREARPFSAGQPSGYLGAIAVGMAFGAGWTPCLGPVLTGLLGMAALEETFWQGVGLLGVYSAGLAVPFLLSAVAVDRFLETFQKFRKFIPVVEKASGALLIVVGLLLVTGTFTAITSWLIPFTPDFLFERI
jgi:cytochrome c-type biogenesis protein